MRERIIELLRKKGYKYTITEDTKRNREVFHIFQGHAAIDIPIHTKYNDYGRHSLILYMEHDFRPNFEGLNTEEALEIISKLNNTGSAFIKVLKWGGLYKARYSALIPEDDIDEEDTEELFEAGTRDLSGFYIKAQKILADCPKKESDTNENDNDNENKNEKMAKKTPTAEMVMKALTNLDLNPELKENDDIEFQYEGRELTFTCVDSEKKNIWRCEDTNVLLLWNDDAKRAGLYLCNKMNKEMNVARAYFTDDMENVNVCADVFADNQKDLNSQVEQVLKCISYTSEQLWHEHLDCEMNIWDYKAAEEKKAKEEAEGKKDSADGKKDTDKNTETE